MPKSAPKPPQQPTFRALGPPGSAWTSEGVLAPYFVLDFVIQHLLPMNKAIPAPRHGIFPATAPSPLSEKLTLYCIAICHLTTVAKMVDFSNMTSVNQF